MNSCATADAKSFAVILRDFDARCTQDEWEHDGTGTVETAKRGLLVSTPTFLRFVGGSDACRGSSLVDADFIVWARNNAARIADILDEAANSQDAKGR